MEYDHVESRAGLKKVKKKLDYSLIQPVSEAVASQSSSGAAAAMPPPPPPLPLHRTGVHMLASGQQLTL